MNIGDLVIGKGWGVRDHGVGIIIGIEKGPVLKVFWPERGVWCYTDASGVKPL